MLRVEETVVPVILVQLNNAQKHASFFNTLVFIGEKTTIL